QVDTIAAAAPLLRDSTLFLVAAYSGLSWSELAALQWDDIDLDAETIDVRRSLDLDRSMKAPKTRRGRRTVPLMKPGVDALRRWKLASPPVSLVFPNRDNRPLGRSWHRWVLEPVRERTDLHVQMNQLRD